MISIVFFGVAFSAAQSSDISPMASAAVILSKYRNDRSVAVTDASGTGDFVCVNVRLVY